MNRILLITILACLTTASPAKAQSSYNELVEEAMKYIKLDSLTQAENLFRQALKADPTNARNALVFSNLGTVLKRQGKTDEAIKNYTFALNITPYATSILLNRAALYLEKDMQDKAYIDGIIKENAEKAGYYANKTLRKVQKKVGFPERIR